MKIHFAHLLKSEDSQFGDGETSYGRHPEEYHFINPLQASANDWPVQITIGGATRWSKGDFWARKKSKIFALEFITAGNAIFMQDRRVYEAGAGDVLILHKGVDHEYRTGNAGFLHKRFIQMEGYLLDPFMRLSGLNAVDVVRRQDDMNFIGMLKQAQEITLKKPSGFALELSSLAYRMLASLSIAAGSSHPPLIGAVIDHIHRNLDRPLTDEEIAANASLSIGCVRNLFKRSFGITPLQFHLRERMAWAESLLKSTSLSIKEIAIRTGFEDPLYFSRIFRRNFGKSPGQWRAALREPSSPR